MGGHNYHPTPQPVFPAKTGIHLTRRLRSGLSRFLLALPLLLGLAAGAQAQTVSISAPTDANEGNSGTTNKLFSVTLSSAHTAPISARVCYSGTATRGASDDYQSRFSTAISTSRCATRLIPTGDTSINAYGIQIRGDTDAEPDETVIATLSLVNPPTGVTLGTSTATYTILDDDDTTAPILSTVARHSPSGLLTFTNADRVTWRVTFGEAVRNVDGTDFSLEIQDQGTAVAGTTLSVSAVSTSVYDVTASGSGIENANAKIELLIASDHDIEDLSGNALTTPTNYGDNYYTFDNTAPTVASIERQMPTTAMTSENSLTWRVTFTEDGDVVNVDETDFQITGATATLAVSKVSGLVFDVTASGGDLASLTGTVTLSFANNHDIADDVGNALVNTTPTSGTNDNTFELQNTVIDPNAPKLVSIKRHAQEVRNLGTSLVWRVEFDKHLPNVYASDFTLSGATAGLDVRHDLSNYDPKTYKTVVFVYAQGGDLETVSSTVTLNFASNHNIVDFEGRRLASTTPTSGTNENTFTLNPNETLVYFTQENYYVDEGKEAVLTLRLSRLRDTATTINISATPFTATGNGVDYHGLTYSVTIPAYRASGTFRIRTSEDTETEPEESFRLDINPVNLPTDVVRWNAPGATGNDGQAYVLIRDEDTATAKANKEPGLIFDNAHLTWNEADGCDSGTGPTYNVKLKNRPAGPVEVWIKDPDDDNRRGQNAFVANNRLYVENSIFRNNIKESHTKLRFTPDNWDKFQLVNVKVRCSDHYTAQIPIKHRMYTNYIGDKGKLSHAYPGYTGVVDKGWTVHVYIRENDPPITVKPLPAEGTTVDVKEGSHLDFEITLSEAAFKHDSTLTVYLSARGGKAAGVKRRDGRAQSCGGPLDDCLIFTPSNRTQWVRLFAINPGRDELKVEIPQLRWGGLEHVRDWEMRWPVEVMQAGQGSPQQVEAERAGLTQDETPACVSDALLADAQAATTETWRTSPGHVERWSRVLAAFGESNAWSSNPMTIAEAQAQADRGLKRWAPVAPALECLANPPQEEQPEQAEVQPVTPATPDLSLSAGSAVDEGGNATFTVTADPAPATDLTIAWTVAQSGEYLAAPGAGSRTVTLTAGTTSTDLSVATMDDAADEADGSVSVTLGAGTGYTVATGKGSAAVAVRDNDEPVVSITAGSGVTEGAAASFTVSASPVPAAPLDVTLSVAQSGDFAASGETGSRTVTVPVTGSLTFEVATVDDGADEPDGSITATLGTGTGYTLAAAPDNAATVAVSDNDAASSGPTLSIADASFKEDQGTVHFTVTLSEPVDHRVTVHYATRSSSPISARAGQDYFEWKRAWGAELWIPAGSTKGRIAAYIYNDSHDEDPETFEMVLFDASDGVTIADGIAVGTITNSDPMPAAWLSRFGRTVAQQAIDGLSNRIADSRTAGTQGTVAGQAFGQAESVLSSTHSMEYDSAHSTEQVHDRHHFGGTQSQSYDMTVREALLNSSFTATSEKDSQGGSVSFWGRATQGHFDGREGAFSLDGETTTALLGTDYAKDNWLVGLTLIQSDGEGSYTDTDTSNRVPEQICDQAMPAQARQVLCNGAVREGDGEVEASLTAITPYASIQASDSIQLWGTLGQGSGEVTLQPELGDAISSDMSWDMVAMGMRGDLLEQEQGLSLALTADALWSRTQSDKTHELAASDASSTRIRAGLEGSWKKKLENGQLTPRLEVGIRQDGGDAETGTGLEIGGGIAWHDTNLGLSLDLSGRTLVSHDSDDLEDRGYGASFVFDPQPDSQRGLSLTIGQDWGGQSTGGLDALFAEPVSERTGSASESRWHAQAAYGFSMLSGRFTGSPYLDMGITDSTQEYTLGWRLQPVYTTGQALNFTLDIQATHRETDDNEPTQFVGVEVGIRW